MRPCLQHVSSAVTNEPSIDNPIGYVRIRTLASANNFRSSGFRNWYSAISIAARLLARNRLVGWKKVLDFTRNEAVESHRKAGLGRPGSVGTMR